MNISAQEKLNESKNILLKSFSSEILNLEKQKYKNEYKFVFYNNLVAYIQYNDFSEYSYLIIISNKELDRILFDNFDDQWAVITKPHHIHNRFESKGIKSSMKGIPSYDMPILIEEIRKYV